MIAAGTLGVIAYVVGNNTSASIWVSITLKAQGNC